MPKRKVKKGWKAISNPIITPNDYSNDGREEERAWDEATKNYESDKASGERYK